MLLTERQREIYEAYALENYSLAEIADGFRISRQAVYDNIKRTEGVLAGYEEKLGLVGKFTDIKNRLEKIKSCTDIEEAKKIAGEISDLL